MIGLELTSNFAKTVLASPINASATTITLFPGAGALFPNPSGGNYFRILITDIATSNYNEIVLCTARSGDVLTVTRNAEGTLARSWLAGDIIENVMTAGAFSELRSQGLNSNTAIGALSLDSVTTGANNSAVGTSSLRSNTTGTGNSTLGYQSARYLSNGYTALTIATNSTYIGSNTKASANNVTNETVIGYNAIGSGSNTITIGGSAVTGTVIPYGNLSIGGSTTISVTDNTNAALRITQLGTGNALLIEDSANPDSTPFVVDANGRVFIGATTSAGSTSTGLAPKVQIVGTGATTGDVNPNSTLGVYRFFNDNGGPICAFFKSNSATPNTFASVNNNDTLGSIFWQADDGASFPRAASISAAVDGTPGTNDMPGRLVFSTTANGASSPTERMRIDSAGRVGIGSTSTNGFALRLGSSIGATSTTYGIYSGNTHEATSTTSVNGIVSQQNTAAASFTVPIMRNFYASQGTIGAGSAITSQYGFIADSSLTGATNNFAFQGSIAAGTGRYNLYMAGTASNYLGGPLITAGLKATSAAAPTIASATTISPTTQIAFVSGTTAIATITAPSPISLGGGQITLIPTGIFTTTTAGNIALASTAVVGKALIMTYDATTTKWYPSY